MPLSRRQAEFLCSQAKYTLFCAGVGSGKTKAGSMWAVREACSAPGFGLVGANTYTQLTRVTLRAFLEQLDEFGLPYVFGRCPPASWGRSALPKHDMVVSILVGGEIRQVICAQLGTYDYIRGIELRWFWIDETRDTKREAFDVLQGRLRGGPADARRAGVVTTTPDGFNWLYDYFVSSGELALSDRAVIYATSHDNPWLPEGYVESLMRNYSPRMAQQEIGGKFVSMVTGAAFAEFSRSLHIDDSLQYDPALPLVHTWDFNVNPLCSCIIQVKGGVVHVIDEIHIEGSARTRDGTEEFIRRHRKHKGDVYVYGDSSGRAAGTSHDSTDYTIIGQAYRAAFDRVHMRPNYANPGVFNSVQDVNAMLQNAKGEVRLKFHPRCEYTIRDMEQVGFKPGTRDIDKSNPTLTHHSDALRYYITQEHPMRSRAATGLTPRGM